MQFDYAWKWFNFHAEQRTRMFNYMLIGMGIFATALVSAIDKKLKLEAVVVGFAAAIVAGVFFLIDRRNRQLYVVAMDVLIHLEKTVMFGEAKRFKDHRGRDHAFGVSGRVAEEDGAIRGGRLRYFNSAYSGQHRHWIPFIALSFGALFGAAAIREWLLLAGAVPKWWVVGMGVLLLCAGAGYITWRRRTTIIDERDPSFLAPCCVVLGGVMLSCGLFTSWLDVPLERRLQVDTSVVTSLDDVTQAKVAFGAADQVGVLGSVTFKGYGRGISTLDCSAPENQAASHQLLKWLNEIQQRNERPLLIFVGSTDRSLMTPGTQGRYGSSNGLARARTEAAYLCLGQGGLPAPADVMHLVGGPNFTAITPVSPNAVNAGLAADRVVRASVIAFR